MKVKDMVAYLQTLEQEDELLFADYYYEDRQGFVAWVSSSTVVTGIASYIVRPADSAHSQHYPNDVYLVDLMWQP